MCASPIGALAGGSTIRPARALQNRIPTEATRQDRSGRVGPESLRSPPWRPRSSVTTTLLSTGKWIGFKEKARKSLPLTPHPAGGRRPLQRLGQQLRRLVQPFGYGHDVSLKLEHFLL